MNLNTFVKQTLILSVVGVAISINLHICALNDPDSNAKKHLNFTDYQHSYFNSQAVPIFFYRDHLSHLNDRFSSPLCSFLWIFISFPYEYIIFISYPPSLPSSIEVQKSIEKGLPPGCFGKSAFSPWEVHFSHGKYIFPLGGQVPRFFHTKEKQGYPFFFWEPQN